MKSSDLSSILNNLSRLKWACRRGMLELDVLLSNFLAETYPSLTQEDKALFVELLNYSDPEIFAWVMGRETPPEVEMQKITGMIREHAQSRI
ncbi:MAG: hypothetical protein ACD_46C00598G0002 [uncultured bacterium]|nr:MAG: hypothetical protein ACD_46C00598G0002 [uncultured bacterium]